MEDVETDRKLSDAPNRLEFLHHLYLKEGDKLIDGNRKRKHDAAPPSDASSDLGHHLLTEVGQRGYSLSWKEFPGNITSFFRELKDQEELVDVTLACDGHQILAHKLVLSASSALFRSLLKNNPCQHPIIILNEVRYSDLAPLLHYMYNGEVNVEHDEISTFLRTARLLQIRGLAGDFSDDDPKVRATSSPKPEKDEYPGLCETRTDPLHVKTSSPKRKKITKQDQIPERQSPIVNDSKFEENENSLDECMTRGKSSLPHTPELPLHMQIPSLMSSLPSVTSTLPPAIPSVISTSSFSHFPVLHPGQALPATADDASDTCLSDRSDERDRDLDVEDEENCLDKISGLANMAALKGLTGFAGPSSLLNLSSPGHSLIPNSESSQGRSRFDFYRVRATDPRPCHLCGKIYKNAHTLRTHMEDKHSNCNGFRCVLCGTVAKSRNSLHSHMSRQHRGISTKDLPLLPMPAPWNPEIASKYIQLVGGVGEVVRQNYRRIDKENSNSKEGDSEMPLESNSSTPTSQDNNAISPYPKSEIDKDRGNLDLLSQSFNANHYASKNAGSSLFDTYLHMMRASGMDLMQGIQEKVRQDFHLGSYGNYKGVLDLATKGGSPEFEDNVDKKLDQLKEQNGDKEGKQNGRVSVSTNSMYSNNSDNEEETKWNMS